MPTSLTRAQRAERAQHLLDDPLLAEGFAALKDGYVAALRGCAAKDDLGRYRYAVALDVIDGLNRHLQAALTLGKLSPKVARELQSASPLSAVTRIF